MKKRSAVSVLSALLAMGVLASASAEAAKSPPTKTGVQRSSGKSKRQPAQSQRFYCEDPEISSDAAPAMIIMRLLNEKCDPSKNYTVTMSNPGSSFPITVCCVPR